MELKLGEWNRRINVTVTHTAPPVAANGSPKGAPTAYMMSARPTRISQAYAGVLT